MSDVQAIKDALMGKTKKQEPKTRQLSTGSTLLNLALSGQADAGFLSGKYYFLVGDSSSGKTFLSLTCLAEASINKAFADYRFIYDDVEGGALMDFERYFGKEVARRVEPPMVDDEGPIYSSTVEEFYFNLDDALQSGPCIYILDSMDGLSSVAEVKRFGERKEAIRGGNEAKGDYGDGKAKINSAGLRSRLADLRDTGSILIITNQTRDNINAGMFEPKKTRSGGHALTFYATAELWSSIGSRIKRTVRGKTRIIGVNCAVRIKKNRQTGKDHKIEVPIYYDVGIDDVGACVDYLVAEGTWKKVKQSIKAVGLPDDPVMSQAKLIEHVQEHKLEPAVRELVQQTWNEIEEACATKRKPRYQ